MAENAETNEMPNRSNCSESYNGYLKRAFDACEAGDLVLGMHLYLAAYERGVVDPAIPDGMALTGLREAWQLACRLKERSMAEYVFEKLEPYLTSEEIAMCAQTLQGLALDRLEQYGFSREELEEMAEMISQDFVGDGSVMKVESITIPSVGTLGLTAQAPKPGQAPSSDGGDDAGGGDNPPVARVSLEQFAESLKRSAVKSSDSGIEASSAAPNADDDASHPAASRHADPHHVGVGTAAADDFNPYDQYADNAVGKSFYAATNEGSGAYVFTRDVDRIAAGAKAHAGRQDGGSADASPSPKPALPASGTSNAAKPLEVAGAPAQPSGEVPGITKATAVGKAANDNENGVPEIRSAFNYKKLAGYDDAIALMREYGIGLQHDQRFIDFVSMLNEQHGLDRAPAIDTLLFRSAVIEDASRFIEATIGEIGLPALHMSMEEGFQGMPLLCVTTQGNFRPRMNHANNRFEAPAILVIENLDTWIMPSAPDNLEGMNGFVMANISRGAREAINLIRSAVEDPDVFVLASATTGGEVDPFFYEVLEPMTIIDISEPNDKERLDIWTEIAREHPSMRPISRSDLMRYSEGLSRYELYLAARDAIEEAYKIGLSQRSYVPVSPYNIFEKLAACQPLESPEYQALEDEVIRSFQKEIDRLDGLLGDA